MPRIFRFGEYWIYFWTNENKPLEPVLQTKNTNKSTQTGNNSHRLIPLFLHQKAQNVLKIRRVSHSMK